MTTPVKVKEKIYTRDEAREACCHILGESSYLAMESCRISEKHDLPIPLNCGSPFTNAGNICGVDKLCRWMMKKPEVVHHLLRLSTDHILEVAQYWVDTFGAEKVQARGAMPTESNQVISPRQYEEFVVPYQKELHEKLFAMGIKRFLHLHLCGDQNLNLPYIARLPMGDTSLVSFSRDVDLASAIKYLGGTCIIAGNVSTPVIQTGTPQQVYQLCRQAIEKGRQAPTSRGGFNY